MLWFWFCLHMVIWICSVLELYFFFNKYFGFVFRFVNFVLKGPKKFILFLKKLKHALKSVQSPN